MDKTRKMGVSFSIRREKKSCGKNHGQNKKKSSDNLLAFPPRKNPVKKKEPSITARYQNNSRADLIKELKKILKRCENLENQINQYSETPINNKSLVFVKQDPKQNYDAFQGERADTLRFLAENLPHGVLMTSGYPPKIVFINSTLAEMLGASVDDLKKMPMQHLLKLLYPDEQKKYGMFLRHDCFILFIFRF